MRPLSRAAVAVLLGLFLSSSASAQTGATAPDVRPMGSTLPADTLRDLPIGDSVYAALETMQHEVIADRFNSGGLNVGGDTRLGAFLASWSQTLFRVGDIDVSDPTGAGSALIVPDAVVWQAVHVATGLMRHDESAPGLAVTLDPRRAGTTWRREISASGTGGTLAASAPLGQPPPINRLQDAGRASWLVSGPVSDRVGLVAGGTWARASKRDREALPDASDRLLSGFTHLVFTPADGREWRTLAVVQRAETPYAAWRSFGQPAATTRSTAYHVQSTWERRGSDARSWRVVAGLTERTRTNEVAAGTADVERITDGPVPDVAASFADSTNRRWTIAARIGAPPRAAAARHLPEVGIDVSGASSTSADAFGGGIRESVNGIPARRWTFRPSGLESRRSATTVAGVVRDVFALSRTTTLDASVRAEWVRGRAAGAATSVNWLSLLPRARFRWEFAERRHVALVAGYARSANALTLDWLAFGDPAASTATVASAASPAVVVARVGPGTGGDAAFSRIDDTLSRPTTDEFVVGLSGGPACRRGTLVGIARRETHLLGVVDAAGSSASNHAAIQVVDAAQNWVDPVDDRPLTIYNRLPASFGRDTYLVTNPAQDPANAFALELTAERTTERLFLLFGASASIARGSAASRGYGPLENDQDIPGELFTNINAATYARGRLFADRAFTIKWTTLYRLPGDVTVGAIARYQDGQPFSRLVIVPDLNQGAEGVQAYPNAGSRFTFTGSLDVRVQRGFELGGARLDAILDTYNLLTRSNEVEEFVVTSPDFRQSTAIEPPHTIHLGFRLSF
ncbi:MAG: hypothetical protein U0Q12_19520 [Vicinamibacterales bacterium]